MKKNEMINLIAKIMNEDVVSENEYQSSFHELQKRITENLSKVLDEGLYNDSSSIMSSMKDCCDDMEIINSIPILAGKKIINFFTKIEDIQIVLGNTIPVPEYLQCNSGIPVFLVGNKSAKEDIITAITYSNRQLEVTSDEYIGIADEMKEVSIEHRRLVQLFIVESNKYFENLCLCIWQDKMLPDHEMYKYFIQNAEKTFLIGTSAAKISRRMLALDNIMVDIIGKKNDLEKIKSTLTQRQMERIKAFYEENSVGKIIANYNSGQKKNYLFVNKIEDILLDVMVYYTKCINHFKNMERMLNEDSLHLPEGSIKEQVNICSTNNRNQRKQFEKALENYRLIFRDIIDTAYEYQNKLQRNLLGEELVTQMHYPDLVLENIYFKYLKMKDFESAKECVRCMKDYHHKYSEIFESFMKYSEGKTISEQELELIEKCPAQESSVARIQIELFDIIRYSLDYLIEIVVFISDLKYAKEYYIYAEKMIKEAEYFKAADFLKKSLAEGYIPAGKRLLEISIEYPECDVTMQQLADMIIPDANFYLGINEFDTDEIRAKVNLKIAAAKKHEEAIEVIADMLFEENKNLSLDEMEKAENQENVINIINLYEFLNERHPDLQYTEHIGLMYCKLQDFKRALRYLKDVETPEAYYQCALMYEHGDGVAVNKKRALEYYRKCGNYLDASVLAFKISDEIRREKQNKKESDYYKNGYSGEREVVSVERSGYCFITTAACIALNETKDCRQLNTLRWFRDNYISDGGEGDLLISEYYRIGPVIVSHIDREWNPIAIYSQLWKYYILPSCFAIEKRDWEGARNVYVAMVKQLCEKYKISVDEQIMKKFDIRI